MFSQTFSIRIFFLARMKIKTRLFLLSKILFLQCGMFQNDSLISVGAGADKYGQVGSWTAVAFIGCWRWVRKMGRRGARHHPTEPEPGQHSLQHVPVHQVTRCTSHLSDLTCLLSSCSLAFLRISSKGLTLMRFGMFPAFSVSRIAIQTFFYFVSLFFLQISTPLHHFSYWFLRGEGVLKTTLDLFHQAEVSASASVLLTFRMNVAVFYIKPNMYSGWRINIHLGTTHLQIWHCFDNCQCGGKCSAKASWLGWLLRGGGWRELIIFGEYNHS